MTLVLQRARSTDVERKFVGNVWDIVVSYFPTTRRTCVLAVGLSWISPAFVASTSPEHSRNMYVYPGSGDPVLSTCNFCSTCLCEHRRTSYGFYGEPDYPSWKDFAMPEGAT